MNKNSYEILDVDPSATNQEILVAYRKLAFQYHPDVNPSDDASQKFTEVNEAYRVLMDPTKRQNLDMTLGVIQRKPLNSDSMMKPGGLMDIFADLYKRLVKISKESYNDQGPLDIQSDLKITANEALSGGPKQFQFEIVDFDDSGEEKIEAKSFKIHIPPKTKEGTMIRLKGMGRPNVNENQSGDLLLKVNYI